MSELAAKMWASLRALCAEVLEAALARGVAVSVMTEAGHSGLVYCTDEVARQLDESQFSLGEGPGIDAFREGHPVLAPDLGSSLDGRTAGDRWPGFIRAAREAGAGAVFALPLQLGAIRVGVLLLIGPSPDHSATRASVEHCGSQTPQPMSW